MKIFEGPNLDNGWKCPICNKNTELPIALIPIYGTEEGNISKAEQIHIDCLNPTIYIGVKPGEVIIADSYMEF